MKAILLLAALLVLASTECAMEDHAPATPANAGTGELLYNGIVLPKEWPPQLTALPGDPVEPFYLSNPPEVIPIDLGRQLFVDDFLIQKTTLTRALHRPEYYPTVTVLRGGASVWYHPSDGLIKTGNGSAVSRDGVHWERQRVEIIGPHKGDTANGGHSAGMAWLDLEETDPAKRYKSIFPLFYPLNKCRYWVRFSPDGSHWSDAINTGGDCGDASKFFYNPFRKVWVFSMRHGWTGPRCRRYWEVRDIEKGPYWNIDETRGPIVRAPFWVGADSADPPHENLYTPRCQLYNLDAVAYESLMLGSFVIWHGQPVGRVKPNEVCLGFSRDGWSWSRPDRRAAFPVVEDPGHPCWINVQSSIGMWIVMGDRLYGYVSCRGPGGGLALGTIRRDGFISMDAGPEGGALTTRQVTFSGKYLFVNVDAPDGALTAEALDENGAVIAPFTQANCVAVRDDKTLAQVTWKGASDLGALAGKPVRFRFHLTSGRLYAFWVSAEESGASRGYVGAGGPGYTGPTDTVGIAAYRAVCPLPADGRPAAPIVWPYEGKFTGSASVQLMQHLSAAARGDVIRYTTDGSDPREASAKYEKPIRLTANAEVKARVFRAGKPPSDVISGQFAVAPDTTPPLRFGGKPCTTLASGTREVHMTLRTNEKATCRYAAQPGVSFDEMPNALESDDGCLHGTVIRGLTNDQVYRFFVKAKDEFGNVNADDYEIAFGVRNPATAPPAYIVTYDDVSGDPTYAPPKEGPFQPFVASIALASGNVAAPMAAGEYREAGVKYVMSPKANEGAARFAFKVPAEGDYLVYARVFGDSTVNDSLFVSMDGGPEDVFDFDPTAYGQWQSLPVNGRGSGGNGRAFAINPRVFHLQAGEHAVVFRSRKPGAKLDRIAVTADREFVMPEPDAKPPAGAVLLEAVKADLTAPMAASEAPAFSVNYLASPEANKGQVAFTFTVPATNDYIVWARVFSPASTRDTFLVAVDGRDEDVFDASWSERFRQWIWQRVNGRDGYARMARSPRVFVLAKGEHVLTFRCVGSGARLASVVITDDRSFVPAAQ